MDSNTLRKKLTEKGLKVTPQRLAVFDAITKLNNHPSAECIIEFIHKQQPNIAIGTVYKVLDTLVENNLIKRVNTEHDVMRYDAVMNDHHHIYLSDSKEIKDYEDKELSELLANYFQKKKIPGIKINELKLQIVGTISKEKNK